MYQSIHARHHALYQGRCQRIQQAIDCYEHPCNDIQVNNKACRSVVRARLSAAVRMSDHAPGVLGGGATHELHE